MNKKILFLTTMYPTPLRPGTKVCHFFTKQWVDMGHEVLVIHYRSIFPLMYYYIASGVPYLRKRIVGSNVKLDRNNKTQVFEEDNIPIYSVPIFKLFPHGRFTKTTIEKKTKEIILILKQRDFIPDIIVGHFYNPQLEIVSNLKQYYPNAKACVTLHERGEEIKRIYDKETILKLLNNIDLIGYRSEPIRRSFEECFGSSYNSFLCWSGTPDFYIKTPLSRRKFSGGPLSTFIYVGDLINRKYPKQAIEGVHKAMHEEDFSFTFVGAQDVAYEETIEYIKSNNISDKVLFTGKIPREEILRYYDQSDCFILISRDEVFGLVYLEAMSRGCITIAARNEGMEGIIKNGENGFLCGAGDTEELASIIKHINSLSVSEKERISINAITTAKELSDYNVAKRYLDYILR